MADQEMEFLGQGWAFPVLPDAASHIGMVEAEEDIRQAILIILGTAPGERVMRPDFGAGLQSLIFEPLNTTTMALVRHRVEEALIIWEPRIDSLTVRVNAEPAQGLLLITITYRMRSTNTFYNIVYPFYLLEGERS
jgi:hypothetical protein